LVSMVVEVGVGREKRRQSLFWIGGKNQKGLLVVGQQMARSREKRAIGLEREGFGGGQGGAKRSGQDGRLGRRR